MESAFRFVSSELHLEESPFGSGSETWKRRTAVRSVRILKRSNTAGRSECRSCESSSATCGKFELDSLIEWQGYLHGAK